MRVRLGWSGETEPNKWAKADVELEEEDLNRLMVEHDIPDAAALLGTKVCFQLLKNEAETLLLLKLVDQGYPRDKAGDRISTLQGQNDTLLKKLADKYAVAA